ncbi:MAG: type I secretion system permease/ATPase [Prosthecochloris sp.]|nr:type I secretion system permease/ATPase [Prosthecochloris sp.]
MQHEEQDRAREDQPVGHDALLESLLTIGNVHGHTLQRESLTAGLPLQKAKLTPGLFSRAAKRAGFNSRIVRRSIDGFTAALLPVILLLDREDACVLHRIDQEKKTASVTFSELSDTIVDIPLNELEARYRGIGIYVRPLFRYDIRTPEVRKLKRRHWFWGVIEENKPLYRDILVAAVMINLMALAMPLFIRNVYDRVLPNLAIETLWVTASAVIVVLCADVVLRLMRVYFIDKAAGRADVKLSASIMEQVQGLRMENRPASVGSFASNLQAFEFIRTFIASSTVAALVDLPFALLFVLIIMLISWPLAIPVLIGAGVIFLYAVTIQGKLHDLTEKTYRVGAQRNATLIEGLTGMETIKILGAEGRFQAKWEQLVAYLSRIGEQLRFLSATVSTGAYWVQNAVSVAIIIVGVYLAAGGHLSMGGLIAVYILSSRAMAPVSQSAALLTQYHQAETSMTSLNEIMARRVERPADAEFVAREHFRGDIVFRNVGFTYPNQEQEALADVSFHIRPGEHIAVLGKVGSGKTTLERLISGLYQPSSGSILIDGVDSRQLDPAELRSNIGHVPQDVMLFFGSLRENVTMSYPQATDQEILRASKVGTIDQFVDKHPHGFQMQVGERGENLSGGQRQGVAIARAVIADPPILLLDEPTSSMDTTTEALFKRRLQQFSAGKTMLIVTHRTSLLELVDRIIILDAGRVVADGPKEKVLEALKQGKVKRGDA